MEKNCFPPTIFPSELSVSSSRVNAPLEFPSELHVMSVAVIIVERRHHFHRELVIALVLATIAILAIMLSTLYAWICGGDFVTFPTARASGAQVFLGSPQLVLDS
jgi:hypothetical protein